MSPRTSPLYGAQLPNGSSTVSKPPHAFSVRSHWLGAEWRSGSAPPDASLQGSIAGYHAKASWRPRCRGPSSLYFLLLSTIAQLNPPLVHFSFHLFTLLPYLSLSSPSFSHVDAAVSLFSPSLLFPASVSSSSHLRCCITFSLRSLF